MSIRNINLEIKENLDKSAIEMRIAVLKHMQKMMKIELSEVKKELRMTKENQKKLGIDKFSEEFDEINLNDIKTEDINLINPAIASSILILNTLHEIVKLKINKGSCLKTLIIGFNSIQKLFQEFKNRNDELNLLYAFVNSKFYLGNENDLNEDVLHYIIEIENNLKGNN